MKKTNVLMVVAVVLMSMQCGCSKSHVKTGFLTDYSRLRKESSTSLRFKQRQKLAQYFNYMYAQKTDRFDKLYAFQTYESCRGVWQ